MDAMPAPEKDPQSAVTQRPYFNSMLYTVFTVLLTFSSAEADATFTATKALTIALVSPEYQAVGTNLPVGVAPSRLQPLGFVQFT